MDDSCKDGLIGVQGGPGSYNDIAIRTFLSEKFNASRIKFLDSTPNVFRSLKQGEIRYGQFAVFNSLTGFYNESLKEIASNCFDVVSHYSIPVNHSLMIKDNQELPKIDRILTHKEVIKQCHKTLKIKYGAIPIEFTSGSTLDPAEVALKISSDPGFFRTAVIGNPLLAKIHKLKIIDENLSDDAKSRSTFLLVTNTESYG